MLVHVVLMRSRPGASSAALDDLARRVSRLTESVAGPDSCVVGPNVTEESLTQEFEFGFAVRFTDDAELNAYHVDPTHFSISLAMQDVSRTILAFELRA
jgi:hypothetical protein